MTDNNGGNGNGEKPKHPGGKPRRWADPEKFAAAIEDYFIRCDNTLITKKVVSGKGQIVEVTTPTPYTMAGLAYHLDIERTTLNNYKYYEDRPEYLHTLMRARKRIEEQNVTHAVLGCHDARIAALNLASNYGYHTSELQHVKGSLTLSAISFDGWTERQIADYLTHGLLPGQAQEGPKALPAGGQEPEPT